MLEGNWRVNMAGDNFIERMRETIDHIIAWPAATFYTPRA